ncbi:LacI family DNA-binding transcriptional regulator [Streptomyces paludis]|uniref:LacI family DNA-binding transcriptional regulator n=1 Tax=Streptomyces paludis TaxID=2282738 RepID=A0A345HYD2_9ACTN|nr:LacI family DNA-binding transcriptional regulator [Streptomyces paludis]AXG81706.1 LacI family DNA-binding transcriptional regulator [Streptomyces paludis]
MGHPYPLREIAWQAGLSEATVDRVLNGRGGVRGSTAAEVHRAIAELDRQRTQVRLVGRTFMIDIVMQSPDRFSTAVRAALEAELPSLHPAVVRSRFHFRETGPVDGLVATLDRIARRGTQGVILKAPDVPEVTAAVGRLVAAGIPVVTLVTDLPASGRLAYVGIDNRAAGATAAYLMGQWLGDRPGNVLTSLSSGFFRNEEEREMGFRGAMRALYPGRTLVEITEGQGLDETQYRLVHAALERDPEIRAVYSMGGGNAATLAAFEALGRECAVFIAHDLDHENTGLLRDHRLSAVLHHDLRQDMRHVCGTVMRAHGALPAAGPALPSAIQVVTPYNMPPEAPAG